VTRWVRADDFLRNFRTPPLQAHGSKRIRLIPCFIFSSAAISKKPRSSSSNSPSKRSFRNSDRNPSHRFRSSDMGPHS
jgi:hypothetical protein